jgi:hypothetical protein
LIEVGTEMFRCDSSDDLNQHHRSVEKKRKINSFTTENHQHTTEQMQRGLYKLGSVSSIVRATLTTPKFNEKEYDSGPWSPNEVIV